MSICAAAFWCNCHQIVPERSPFATALSSTRDLCAYNACTVTVEAQQLLASLYHASISNRDANVCRSVCQETSENSGLRASQISRPFRSTSFSLVPVYRSRSFFLFKLQAPSTFRPRELSGTCRIFPVSEPEDSDNNFSPIHVRPTKRTISQPRNPVCKPNTIRPAYRSCRTSEASFEHGQVEASQIWRCGHVDAFDLFSSVTVELNNFPHRRLRTIVFRSSQTNASARGNANTVNARKIQAPH